MKRCTTASNKHSKIGTTECCAGIEISKEACSCVSAKYGSGNIMV